MKRIHPEQQTLLSGHKTCGILAVFVTKSRPNNLYDIGHRSRSKAIACNTPSYASDHLFICATFEKNPSRRADVTECTPQDVHYFSDFHGKVMAKLPQIYWSRSKVIAWGSAVSLINIRSFSSMLILITVTSHECHDVWNLQQLYYLFNSLLRKITKETSKFSLMTPCERNPLMTSEWPQRASNVDNISVPWHQDA